MTKRSKLEIIKDILEIIQRHHGSIRITPLIRHTNLSSSRFKEYYLEMLSKSFISESKSGTEKTISLEEKGKRFLSKYSTIVCFIQEFEL